MFLDATLWNTISAIRVAYIAKQSTVEVPTTNNCLAVLRELVKTGAITSYTVHHKIGNKKIVTIYLHYLKGMPCISQIAVISKRSNRTYITARSLAYLLQSSKGCAIISTSYGIMLGQDACTRRLGGELLLWINY